MPYAFFLWREGGSKRFDLVVNIFGTTEGVSKIFQASHWATCAHNGPHLDSQQKFEWLLGSQNFEASHWATCYPQPIT